MARAAPATAAVVLTISVIGSPPSAQTPPSLDQVMERFTSYLRTYGEQYAATVSTEQYVQAAGERSTSLDSEFAIVKLPGISAWLGFRDVLRVDGRFVEDREARLSRLFAEASSAQGITQTTTSQAMRVVHESARFNIGMVERTINNPAVVLELLAPSHHRGFRFTKNGEDDIEGTRVWRIGFAERRSPTVIRTLNGRDIPTTGDVWVDPATGRLLRADVTMRLQGLLNLSGWVLLGRVSVTFKENSDLKLFLPDKMVERYESANGPVIQRGEATYTNYRQFRVDSRVIP